MDTRKPASVRLLPVRKVNATVELPPDDEPEDSNSNREHVESAADDDSGGDPYNCTGQFFVPAPRHRD